MSGAGALHVATPPSEGLTGRKSPSVDGRQPRTELRHIANAKL